MTDDGYFPRDRSVLRRVHEERAVGLMYGQRALGIGAIAPLNFIGTRLHTRALDKPFQRLVHTAKAFETIFFGSRAEADEVLEAVHRLHEGVHGVLPEAAGPYPAGTPYSAFDPELTLWTVAVIADSAQVFYELFVGPLTGEERDGLWSDYVRFAEGRLAGDDAYLTDEARYVGSAIMFQIPVPATRRPAMRVHNLVMLGSLPARVRELYEFRWTTLHEAAFRTTVAALKAPRPLAPERIRTGRCTAHFDLVAHTERARLARGDAIPGALA